MLKGWPTQEKEERLVSQLVSVEPVRELQHGLTVLSHATVRLVASDAAEAASTAYSIVATSHSARPGDVIAFTSGTHSGREVKVYSVTANLITLAETLSSAVATGVTFGIYRHKYPVVDAAGSLTVSGTFTPSPVQFVLNGVDTEVLEDTVTPANNRPLPVKLVGASGEVQITAGNLSVDLTHASDSVKIGDGTDFVAVTGANELSVLETNSPAIAASLSVLDDWDESDRAKVNPITGQAGVQGGSGTVSANTQRVVLATDVALPAGTNAIGKLSSNDGVDIGDITINNAAGASAVNIQDGGNSITVDGAVAATQSGAWNINDVSGTVSLPTGASTAANQAIGNASLASIDAGIPAALGQTTAAASMPVVLASDQPGLPMPTGRAVVTTVRNDYSSVNVTTGAWVQLVASTSAIIHEFELFDSSGQTLELGIGAAASETRLIIIFPGGNWRIPVKIAAGTRISVRAISATASVGELDINFYGV